MHPAPGTAALRSSRETCRWTRSSGPHARGVTHKLALPRTAVSDGFGFGSTSRRLVGDVEGRGDDGGEGQAIEEAVGVGHDLDGATADVQADGGFREH